MQLRKYGVICAVVFAIIFFVIGSLVGLVTVNTSVASNTESFSDQNTINPDSQIWRNFTVTEPGSWLLVTFESTDNISLFINFGGELEYFKLNETYLENNFLLRDAGEWNFTLSNNSSNPVSYNYIMTLSTLTNQPHKPFAWVLSPTFTAGEISIVLILPMAFIDRIRAKWSRKATEVLLLSVIALTILGFTPLLTLFTGTTVQSFVPTTSSMEPVIWPGDLVVVQSTNPNTLNVGDVIVFGQIVQNTTTLQVENLNPPYCHRIYGVETINNAQFFTTKGDRGNTPDTWIVPENGVNGQAILVIPRVGILILLLSQLNIKISVISITLIILIISIVIENTKKGKKNEKKTNEK